MTAGQQFSITIEASSDQAGKALPRFSAVVETDENETLQIIEFTVGAVDGGPIPPTVAQNIDFAMLTDALNRVVSAISSPAAERAPASRPAVTAPSPRKSTRMAKVSAMERPYRRMPDAEEVSEIFRRTQSVGKLAQHYDVPRYTAQAWVDRLRRTGQLGDVDARH